MKPITLNNIFWLIISLVFYSCGNSSEDEYYTISNYELKNKIKGAWAAQAIGVTYGGPTEFRYLKRIIPDSVEIVWTDTTLQYWMNNVPGLYDDIYMDLTFVEVMEKHGLMVMDTDIPDSPTTPVLQTTVSIFTVQTQRIQMPMGWAMLVTTVLCNQTVKV